MNEWNSHPRICVPPFSKRSHSSLLFWAYCTPSLKHTADPNTYRATKKKAIRRISPTFQAASQVLFVDSDLDVVGDTVPASDIAVNIERRLRGPQGIPRAWTLDEGGQARHC